MKPEIQSPIVTAHALGELPSHEERLLRMTFAHPVSAGALDTEIAEVRSVAQTLRTALQAEGAALSLTAEQREQILRRTMSTKPAARRPAAPAVNEPLSMERILSERKAFDRKPARAATYWTLGAAAAVIVLLAVVRPKQDARGVSAGPGEGTDLGGQEVQTNKFKVIPAQNAAPSDPAHDIRGIVDRQKINNLPPSFAKPFERETPAGDVANHANALLPGQKPQPTAKPEIPTTVKMPAPPPGSEPAGTYASPGPPPGPSKKR